MTDEEKKEYEELKSLLYTGTISQYGKRKLIEIIEKQSKEIEELKEVKWYYEISRVPKDKIKAKIEELKNTHNGDDFNLTNVIMILQSLLEKE